ncbi:uncharacterized protein LOC144658960 isoform X2 [Oculina patagonica]
MISLMFCLTLALSSTVFVVSGSFEGCEENFVKVGCYKDKTRPLPDLLLNNRTQLGDWHDWGDFIKRLACSCANLARSKGFTYFGLQFFGECWSGVKPNTGYDNDGNASPKGCVGQDLTMPCEDSHPVCVGKGKRNYVYKLVTPTPKPDCKDNNKDCPEYAKNGYCKVYKHIRTQCPLSCKEC